MSLVKKDRTLTYFWTTGDKITSESMEGVVLDASALGSDVGYLRITYEYVGWDELADEIKANKDKVF